MKSFILSMGLLAGLSALWVALPRPSGQAFDARTYVAKKKAAAITCAPDRSDPSLLPDDPGDMIPLPGWGKYRWAAVSSVDSAQFYFDQGINMYYSFHIVESLSSFQKAAHLDPSSAMAQWGIALAYGPNINDVVYNYSPLALQAARRADSLSAARAPFEQGLIKAMLARYSDDPSKTRGALDEAYAGAMKKLFEANPGNPDAGTLYADALMLLHPWDLYDHAQRPKAWTPELVATLEKVLRMSPDHPGANHYYIHAVEASASPGRALASADKLGSLLPTVSHMVHMPSHIYIRTGMYDKGNKVNKSAIEGYRAYRQLMPSVENGAFIYLFHNIHMQATCAMNGGTYREAADASTLLRQELPAEYLSGPPPEAEYLQYMYMSELFTEIRFGHWDKILAMPALPDSLLYASILQSFGRSLAYARLHRFSEAHSEIGKMEKTLASSDRLKKRMGAFNTAYAGGEVAVAMAKGVLAEAENRFSEAETWLGKAVQLEDQMVYDEPKDWLLPPRQYLGAVMLKAGKFGNAEAVFRKDLDFNPNNGWSLKGLEMALAAQHREKEWKAYAARSAEVRQNRDFNPLGPVF
jgi:tetratricopeptide (TPR) repeat protein